MKYADKIMNTDKFKNILLSAEGLIRQFRPPADERSIAKGIPIEFLGIFYDYSKMVQPLRIRYRGKSKYHSDGYCYFDFSRGDNCNIVGCPIYVGCGHFSDCVFLSRCHTVNNHSGLLVKCPTNTGRKCAQGKMF